MSQEKPRRLPIRPIWLATGIFILIYALIAWLWYPAFLGARAGGPFWLMVFLAGNSFKMVGLLTAGIPLLFMLRGLWVLVTGRPGRAMLWMPVMTSFVTGVLLFPAGFPIFMQPITHVDTIQAHGQPVHLAAVVDIVDTADYVLYQCDATGQWCKEVFYSAHLYQSTAHLELDPASGDAVVMICDAKTGGSDCQPRFTYHP